MMANLVCWASGLLEVMANKDTPMDGRLIVLATGPQTRMRSLMSSHGVGRDQKDGSVAWFIPGTKPLPADPDESARVQRDNLTCATIFQGHVNRTLKLRGKR